LAGDALYRLISPRSTLGQAHHAEARLWDQPQELSEVFGADRGPATIAVMLADQVMSQDERARSPPEPPSGPSARPMPPRRKRRHDWCVSGQHHMLLKSDVRFRGIIPVHTRVGSLAVHPRRPRQRAALPICGFRPRPAEHAWLVH
jgi:hypothetical protein